MNWHHYFTNIAIAVREKANCLGSKVGAVLVRDGRIIATGYNGTPSGMKNCLDGGCYRCANREHFKTGEGYDRCICVHAEQNALLSAARFGISVEGASVYVTMQPCFGCLKEMLQARINDVHYLHPWNVNTKNVRDQNKDYLFLTDHFKGGVHRVEMEDPRAEWALSKRRMAAVNEFWLAESQQDHGTSKTKTEKLVIPKDNIDETGHEE
jgi:dCMP deaminase